MVSPASLRPRVAVILLSLTLLTLCGPQNALGFWFSSSRAKSQAPQWFGIRDYGAAAQAAQAAYSYDTTGGVTVAVPVAVPLSPHQVQVSPPYPGLGTVQLVPCLCPISKDPDSMKPLPPAPPQPHMAHMPPMAPIQTMQIMPSSVSQQATQPSQHPSQ